ncbi:MAG: alpha-amylase, partial [Anaerolinea sp.]|nr:alpha-amylase [Anaerolinea sp.]
MRFRIIFIITAILIFVVSCSNPSLQTATISETQVFTEEVVPESPWWKTAIFYEIFVRSFNDSNGDGIGDITGIIEKLDYLNDGDPNTNTDLGINAIWLMPINPSPSYHGYDVLNYYAINPQYGTKVDFERLLQEAHKRGIKVIIDLVLNHTSSQHPFFVDARSSDTSQYHDWYVWSDIGKGNYWHETTVGNVQENYYGYFCDCMPDLNYLNPEVTLQMEKVVSYWISEIGVDGFRIDAAKHLIEDSDKVENTPQTHDWFKQFYTFY